MSERLETISPLSDTCDQCLVMTRLKFNWWSLFGSTTFYYTPKADQTTDLSGFSLRRVHGQVLNILVMRHELRSSTSDPLLQRSLRRPSVCPLSTNCIFSKVISQIPFRSVVKVRYLIFVQVVATPIAFSQNLRWLLDSFLRYVAVTSQYLNHDNRQIFLSCFT